MRRALVAASLLAIVAACSADDDTPTCRIDGTYTAISVRESGTCPEPKEQVTYTVTPGAQGGFGVEVQGFQGSCSARRSEACKLEGTCELVILDAKDARNDRGTFQYAWTFTADGFRGTASVAVPDSDSLSGGCVGTVRQTATRR
jgi:hypothetical protein